GTIRLSGGEPLVRVRIEELVGMINEVDGALDITMTTNGVLLRDKAEPLARAGLKRVNISLDTLHIDRFEEIARRDAFARTMEGILAAEESGLRPIKLNMVVMSGKNDDEVVDFARLAREKGYQVRFIEFMPLDGDGIWRPHRPRHRAGRLVEGRGASDQSGRFHPPLQEHVPDRRVTAPAAGSVAGQVALVTGADQGFGRQVALELGARGMAVALAALS